MANVLVLANETIGGKALLDAIVERHEQGDARFFVVVPRARPKYGNVIYDEAVRSSAQVRVDLALAFARQNGIDAHGETGDEDPFNAAMDAIAEHRIDEVFVSTHPGASSGWLRRDLPERIEQATGLPVRHIVVDIANEGLPFDVTLVVANQTVAGGELVAHLKQLAEQGPRRFIVVVPQNSGDGRAVAAARGRLKALLESLEEDGIIAAGMIGDPDPFAATMNAVGYFFISEVVISTLPEYRSRWLEGGLVDRIKRATGKPVEHVESSAEPAASQEAAR
ncbi:MAG TPA: hypothetical protein VM266_11965 [Solirubrobacteraceae bacterium]|nr:hypothetical protein [Solirubrobacteraceae bacterium]